jgi:murein DD-endopeptidase MepM/ murein hydrolase activator NlpD
MAVNPPLDSDAEHGELGDQVLGGLASRLQRAVGFYNAKRVSDRNITVPVAIFNPQTKQRYFEDAPVPLARQFASPLARSGTNADGPHGERHVTSGWGDPRSIQYDANIDSNRRHQGLDFRAAVGESVLASADGIVTFVGAQLRPTASARVASIVHPHTDAGGNVLDASGKVILTPGQLGHGGVFVQIRHNADFQGYWTEYMHLSDAAVAAGDHLLEGQVIGKVGRSGGNRGVTDGPHLHWQVRYLGTIVRPDPLVPHYWPGHDNEDLTSSVGVALAAATAGSITVGESLVASQAANQLQCLERATQCENARGPALKARQADHSQLVANNLALHTSALYDAIGKFQSAQPIVQAPMAFDFDTGLWSPDGKPL